MDLSTRYLGLELKNPLVPSASPLSREIGSLKALEDAGAAAVVLYSLFEEEIWLESSALDQHLSQGIDAYAEALSYFPESAEYLTIPDVYLDHVRLAKEAIDIPVIGSLNGISTGGWVRYAKEIQDAGADALELNMYYLPTDPYLSSTVVEDMYIELLKEVRRSVSIPLAVKIGPFFSSLPHVARSFSAEGAQALVLFNRFYQPDIDIETLKVAPTLDLSSSVELRLPLRWIAILYGKVELDFALTTGVHTAEDVLKGLMSGASITMLASQLLKHGPARLGDLLMELDVWLEDHEYESIKQLIGSMSVLKSGAGAGYERANYMSVLRSYDPEGDFVAPE